MRNSTLTPVKDLAISTFVLICLLLLTTTAFAQQATANAQTEAGDVASLSNSASVLATPTTPAKSQPPFSLLTKRAEGASSARSPQATSGDDGWQFEIRPYAWLAGIYGTVRVNNQTAQVGADASAVLGMLDFVAQAQVEAIKGNWRIMFDENYANLGTTGTGPLGNVTVQVEPTMNIFEFGASYTAVSVKNKNATSTEPLPPVFTAEILGGGRFFRMKLELQANNLAPVEGSRNLIGPFVGNRFKVSPSKAVTLIGKYTVGGSGAGSNFAWSADGLVDLRLKKGFSIGGGYRALGINGDKPSNAVGFDGVMRGLILTMTLYR